LAVARDEETFAPEGNENIPHLLHELILQAAFCTQVINRGILGHYVATASLATGVYETFNNFADVAPANPTVFEYYRKALDRPPRDAWVIALSNGFNQIGQSSGKLIAPGYPSLTCRAPFSALCISKVSNQKTSPLNSAYRR
jgi:hypothetical protein